ncbi:MAG: hypothetical protein K9L98_02525 [Candidatus Pacebacteria bacterium]|nr:hypothetical protein [Candidatus Paceibacterota bacterium]MCF7862861.1 hypothetical protein [Candidatus Paceibacterota bacterium]
MYKSAFQLEQDVSWWEAELRSREGKVAEAKQTLEQRKHELAEAKRYEEQKKSSAGNK